MAVRGCWMAKCINTARVKREGGEEGRAVKGGRKRGEAGEWVLNPTRWDFKGSRLNQICSHPITDCSLHLDQRWRKGWGADSGMRQREGAHCEDGRLFWRTGHMNLSLTGEGVFCSLQLYHRSWQVTTECPLYLLWVLKQRVGIRVLFTWLL